MKLRLEKIKNIKISGEYIRLDSLLKYTAYVSTGGEAKIIIQDGAVFVNGELCMQRGRKIRHGDIVRTRGTIYRVNAESGRKY